MGGNQAGVHHPLAAATSGACATIASDALMNPFDGMHCYDGYTSPSSASLTFSFQ